MNQSKGILLLVALLFLGLFVIQELRFKDRINALRAETAAHATGGNGDAAAGAVTAADLQESVRQLNQARAELASAQRRLNTALNQIAQLQNQVQALGNLNLGGRRPRVGSLSGLEAPDAETDAPSQPVRRAWGEEQATGAPDTHQAGDISTAWASRLPDGGEEWLSLDYSNQVFLAEVRVRETYNPGAISKVAAVLPNGQEQIIWEGVTEPGEAPIEKVFPVSGNIYAKGVKVYLDTRRVPGWNEIDAVELVGRDGTRQWASQASASSSYADPR
jgi:hypothetical protein